MLKAVDITEEVLADLIDCGEHYFSVYPDSDHHGYVTYSRNFSGGAFEGAFRYKLSEHKFTLDAIHKPSRMIRKKFDLSNPQSFDRMREEILYLIDMMQTDRILNTSAGGRIFLHGQNKWPRSYERTRCSTRDSKRDMST